MSTIWLKANMPGFSDLSPTERRAIANFPMLWMLFEARLLGDRGNVAQITQAVQEWDEGGTLVAQAYHRALAYFRDRYFEAGAFTEHLMACTFEGTTDPHWCEMCSTEATTPMVRERPQYSSLSSDQNNLFSRHQMTAPFRRPIRILQNRERRLEACA